MDPSPESSFVSPGWRRRRSISGRELQANKQALTFKIWEPELRVLNSEERTRRFGIQSELLRGGAASAAEPCRARWPLRLWSKRHAIGRRLLGSV